MEVATVASGRFEQTIAEDGKTRLRERHGVAAPLAGRVRAVEPAGVFLLEGGRVRLQPVALGGRNASQAWVTQGLRSGQQVVVYPPAALADGTPVQVRSVPVR